MTSFSQRLHNVIPGGAHTYSRGDDQFSSNTPDLFVRGKGCYTWDNEGNRFLDYGMALRAVTLGYADEQVNAAAIEKIQLGGSLTRATDAELEAAELMVELMPCADMVKFAKNGSNVTTAAAKLARAYTRKPYICIPRQHPFFSFDDWFIGSTKIKRGIPSTHYQHTLAFDYGDDASLQKLFDEYPNQIAAVMLEPATHMGPFGNIKFEDWQHAKSPVGESFLHKVRNLCDQNDSLLIFDEMITGFRWHLNGAQAYFGVTPDLATFGKGMANGFALAALVGKQEVMSLGGIEKEGMERTFLLSSTHGADMPSLAAFIATVKKYKADNVVEHFWNFGQSFYQLFLRATEQANVQDYVYIQGNPVTQHFVTCNEDKIPCMAFRTLFQQEMISKGVLMPWLAWSFAHNDEALEQTALALQHTFKIYRSALDEGIEKYLQGPAVKPVFRSHN